MTELTKRNLEVLKRLADGAGTKAIASELRLSPKTVEYHRAKIYERLGINSVAQLVRWALRHGLTTLSLLLLATNVRASSVNLGWDASPSPGVTAYVVYAATNSLNATNLDTAFQRKPVGTNRVAKAVWTGTNRIYFVVTAAAASVESDPSNVLIEQAPEAPPNLLNMALNYQTSITLPSTNALYFSLQILTATNSP